MRRIFALVLMLFAVPLRAQEAVPSEPPESVVAGLSQETIGINANFDGSAIMIYGAVKRDSPFPDSHLGVIVTLEGPSEPITIRKKTREMGIWVNTESVGIAAVPSFYAVATSAPLAEILTPAEDEQERISPRLALRAFSGPLQVDDARPFTEALLRIREEEGRFSVAEGTVQLQEDTLFRVDFDLPSDIAEGDYKARIFLLRDGEVIDRHRAAIYVRKVGLERWLYATSRETPWAYALMALALAALSGWLASEIFRRIRS